MCGIIGYAGELQAPDVIIDGLKKLEYRGYDSAGLSVFNNGEIKTIKSIGRIINLEELKNKNQDELISNVGIGHTRWATHGKPSEKNAHPHFTDKVSIVHNGIIENYLKLKKCLEEKNYVFETETDSEIVAKLLDYYYQGDPIQAISKVISRLEGAFALAIMFKDQPQKIYGARKECPLIVALGENQNFIASDINAVLEYTNKYYNIDYQEIIEISKDSVEILDIDGNKIKKQINIANWNVAAAQKCGYEHFMLKEINEQPQAINSTISPRIIDFLPDFNYDNIDSDYLKKFNKIFIVACGTAMYAGMVGKDLIEKIARVPVEVDVASEFRYRDPILTKQDLLIVISQSGETADTLAALRLAKSKQIETLAIVNVVGSSIAREADKVITTFAGPEIAVASTKAYIVQVAVMYLLSIKLALVNQKLDKNQAREYIKILMQMPEAISDVIGLSDNIKNIATKYQNTKDMFFLGRGLDFATCLEGSLKLKEISYICCQPYQAGELKHGTISLITDNIPVVCVATQTNLFDKMISNIKEVKARGAKTIFLTTPELETKIEKEIIDDIILLPCIKDIFMPFVIVPVFQLMAYHMGIIKDCDVDKPRNLAKSVTVE
ncbi:MAG: glutamine--fructose-6-phosphate transaminase (isomerizing) [Oscillospiraceae bacterium]|nr:glutamine--fructose-6-phosphate transaminase (isomerizing) [Oscillospiraceae bacterium]